MSARHTPGPWHTGADGTIIYADDGFAVANAAVFHGRHSGADEARENAKRIAACVNAFEGYPIETIEAFSHKALERLTDAERQREALLAALQAIADACGPIAEDAGHADQFRNGWGQAHAKLGAYARAAIAKATGGQK